MDERRTVDARGLSCPIPAILVRWTLLEAGSGTVEVQVDNGTSCENVARLAEREGWQVAIQEQSGGVYQLVLTR
jgi:tRNA 2-thiouridine synthesizing protein A